MDGRVHAVRHVFDYRGYCTFEVGQLAVGQPDSTGRAYRYDAIALQLEVRSAWTEQWRQAREFAAVHGPGFAHRHQSADSLLRHSNRVKDGGIGRGGIDLPIGPINGETVHQSAALD